MLGIFKHYKGGIYTLVSTALHTETGEELMLYMDIEDLEQRIFARPKSSWEELVDGVPRFTLLSEQEVQELWEELTAKALGDLEDSESCECGGSCNCKD